MRSLICESLGDRSARPLSEPDRARRPLRMSITVLVLLLALGGFAQGASAQPGFTQSFLPSTIGPGSASTLQFVITNSTASPVTDLAFTNSLPAGLTVATPGAASSTCSGVLSAADGGTSISLSDGSVAGSSSCTIQVYVTASSGTLANTTGNLTSSAGNSGASSATLTVSAGFPGFSKSFSPSIVRFGERSTLTFDVDNSAGTGFAFNLTFIDNLPLGMVVASPSNATSDCPNAAVTAIPGDDTITYTGFSGLLNAGVSCSVSVDVLGNSVGVLENVTNDLFFTTSGPTQSAGVATAGLTVIAERIVLNKAFLEDPVRPGDSVDLEFTLRNLERRVTASNIAFTDDLDAVIPGLVATSLPANPCGAGSSISGTDVLTFVGGSLGVEETCTFVVTLQVPFGTTDGVYANVTSAVTGDLEGVPTTGVPATDLLYVSSAPVLSKSFATSVVGGGSTVTMDFTLSNPSSTATATGISFTDNLESFLSGAGVAALPSNGFCGASSAIFVIQILGEPALQVNNAELGPGQDCTFSVDLSIPEGTGAGSYTNVTSDVSSTVSGETVTTGPAEATLSVVEGPILSKSFTDDPVAAGDTVTLEFTLALSEEAPLGADGIAFSDDLSAVIASLEAVDLPQSDVCGLGSSLTGTSTVSFSGGSLLPGESCTFSVTLQVPENAVPGTHANTTSNVVSTSGGVSVVGAPAQDDLVISGLELRMSFVDDPVIAGGDVELEYTIENSSGALAASGLSFTHQLNFISGITVSAPSGEPCGSGSSLTAAGTLLIFQGGNLAAESSCTFSITLTIPSSAESNDYPSSTSTLVGNIGDFDAIIDPATDVLTVSSERLQLTKEFVDDPVAPGENVTLTFTVSNLGDDAITGIAFTDDLDAVTTGLASVSASQSDVCGAGSQVSGTSTVSFSGGSLASGASCTFSVTVAVPATVALDSILVNVTSDVTGSVGSLAVFGEPATDELQIDSLSFTKSFSSSSVEAGSLVDLTFTIQNESASSSATDLFFNDDLTAMLPGTQALGLPRFGDCGEESVLNGTTLLTMQGIDLLPGASCTFTVMLVIPASAAPGDYLNATSDLFQLGLALAAPATATLTVTGLDSDDDGVPDVDDNCPSTPNPLQEDSDLDGLGDLCDACALDPDNDVDADGVCGDVDNCPVDANADQADIDGDGVGDACDDPANVCLGTTDGRGCCLDEFDGGELSAVWTASQVGDAIGAALVSGGELQLAGTGSELYHGDDNGAFVQQPVAGDFRMEMDIVSLPVDAGGQYRKAGLMARAGLAPDAARVSVHYLPAFPGQTPGDPDRTALMFDARNENGVAFELASTVPDVSLPVRVAIQRRGDVWSVLYSNDGGASWIHPMGGAGGQTTIVTGGTVLAGPTVTSYSVFQSMTAAFDNVAICRPDGDPANPETLPCDPGADLDVVVVLDRSGSMQRDHGGSGVSKHDAARDALIEMLDGLALRSGTTRAALVTVAGTDDAGVNLASGATIESGFDTPSAIAGLLGTFSLPVSDPIDPQVTSPLAIGLDEALGLLQAESASAAVVVLGSDMTPNIDGFGEGPLAYQEAEVSAIGLGDGSGGYLAAGVVAWLGNFNPMIGTFDGQVPADSMVAVEMLRDVWGDARVFSLIPRGSATYPPVLSEGLADYAAWYTQGAVVGAEDPAALTDAVGGLLTAVDCEVEGPAQISGRIYHDLDGDGVEDAGEPGLGGISVTAGGSSAVTGADGTYVLTVAAGSVTIAVDAAGLGAVNVPTDDPDGIASPDEATLTVDPWQTIGGLDFGYTEDPGGPLEGCLTDGFGDGVLDSSWSAVFLGDADQGNVDESGGTLKIEGDGTTAYAGSDNGVFVYREIEGDYRVEVDVLGFPSNTGGAFRKAGLMIRSGLGPFDARVMAQVVPDFGGAGPVLQFRARTVAGGAGDVAISSNISGVAAPVRLAIEKNGNVYSVQYSTNGGVTWVTPLGGNQGSITANLGTAPLVGMNVVSYDANVTLEAEVDNFEACAEEETPGINPNRPATADQ